MSSTAETVRQLGPHWAVMFLGMFAAVTAAERVVGEVPLGASLVIVLVIAFAYPVAVRALGVAPPVWQR